MSGLHVAVCEDNLEDQLKLKTIFNDSHLSVFPVFFRCGEDLLSSFLPYQYDLICMDIHLPGMTGIRTIGKLRCIDARVPVVIISSSREYAMEGYNLRTMAYVVKPFQESRIHEILDVAYALRRGLSTLHIRKGTDDVEIPFRDILYLEQNLHQVRIVKTNGQCEQYYGKIKDLSAQLNPHIFFSGHRSYTVNLTYVRCVERKLRCFLLLDGTSLPIRRESVRDAEEAFEKLLMCQAKARFEKCTI